MDPVSQLSAAHCLILAAHYASSAEIPSLRTLTRLRSDAFSAELTFQVLLTYLPESADPSIYAEYLHEVAWGSPDDGGEGPALDTSAVSQLSDAQARKRGRKIHLLPLAHPSCPDDIAQDFLTLFLVHRAYRIDAETGLLNLVPELLAPFLNHSEYLNTWFISTVLPLVRLEFEFHPGSNVPPTLSDFDGFSGRRAVETLLGPAVDIPTATQEDAGLDVANDIKGIVGPWMYGDSQRKRRRLNTHRRSSSSINANGTGAGPDSSRHDWDHVFEWMLRTAERDFPMVSGAIQNWDGPGDVDFGGYAEEHTYLPEDVQSKLELRYAQTTLATIYAADTADSTRHPIEHAHRVLTRLSQIMESLGTLPNIDADIASFPSLMEEALPMRHLPTAILQQEALLKPDHALTTPKPESFSLLAALVFSCRLLAELGYETSIIESTRLWLRNDSKEQLAIVQAILHGLQNGSKKSDSRWLAIRTQLLWLWNWGIQPESEARQGAGIFGGLGLDTLEKEILSAMLMCSCYPLVVDTYIKPSVPGQSLSKSEVEEVVLSVAFHHYDNASNGNRTRGGMKKASDSVATFSPHFPGSPQLGQLSALLAATHSLSFYSLTLQHGVPFQPVSIRVSHDPVGLLEKVLAQNPRSYTQLDDLISIGRHLVAARLDHSRQDSSALADEPEGLARRQVAAERRIIGMAIQSALAEDDFETAYSYVVNRLNIQSGTSSDPPAPATPAITDPTLPDDPSWRAALAAGRYRPPPLSANSNNASSHLRTLHQRMDLLTHALLLAPPPSLPEILTAYRRCEEELLSALADEDEVDARFDAATATESTLPGAWGGESGIRLPQQRREVGRAVGRAGEEAPVGLFDVARGAADAFRRNAFAGGRQGGRGAGVRIEDASHARSDLHGDFADGEDRVRKRDMVANAVTGGLASGIGWVLGATPVQQQQHMEQE